MTILFNKKIFRTSVVTTPTRAANLPNTCGDNTNKGGEAAKPHPSPAPWAGIALSPRFLKSSEHLW
jgi:hypothetical protein